MNSINLKLNKEEKKIEEALAKEEFVSTFDLSRTKKYFKEAVENYEQLQKTKRITIRVNQGDLIKVKAKAKRNNIPYQTLLNALIRQFAEGKTSLRI